MCSENPGLDTELYNASDKMYSKFKNTNLTQKLAFMIQSLQEYQILWINDILCSLPVQP